MQSLDFDGCPAVRGRTSVNPDQHLRAERSVVPGAGMGTLRRPKAYAQSPTHGREHSAPVDHH